jgi:hypothetical protein
MYNGLSWGVTSVVVVSRFDYICISICINFGVSIGTSIGPEFLQFISSFEMINNNIILSDYCNSAKNCNEVQLQLLGSKCTLVTFSSSLLKCN